MMSEILPAGLRRATKSCALVAVCLLAALPAACGKKGPPLAPLLHLPAPVEAFSARRLGSTVYVQFTIPTKNQDNTLPADLARIDVYGYTGTLNGDEDIVKYATLVAQVPVRRPLTPEEEDRARARQQQEQAGEPKTAAKPKSEPAEPEPGFDQGATVTVTETLTPALLQPIVVRARTRTRKEASAEAQVPILLPSATVVPLPARVYVAVGVNRKGRRGAFSPHAEVPLLDAPERPGSLKASHTETAIILEWTPPPGAPAVTKAEDQTEETPPLASKPLVPTGGPTWSYNVYEVPGTKAVPSTPPPPATLPQVTVPVPLNPQPLTAPTYTDSRIEFGTERCYVVRVTEAFGALQEQSDASEVACVTPRDTYPPAAPKGLTAVVNAGAVSLIWDPNTEADLDGYLILRGEAPSGTLQPVTRDPIHQTTFNDTTAKPGVRYVYAIVAVDKAGNVSAQSNRVEETAR